MPKHYFAALTRNTISLIGTALVVGSLTLILSLIAVQAIGLRGGAYLGIITFVLLPGVLLLGLVLIPIGIRRERKRAAGHRRGEEQRFPILDMNNERTRKSIIGLMALSTVSVVVLAAATYKGIEVMDSTAFCGTVCHTVMQPEYTAHERSPHARVACAECHIGPGADWFVKSKLSGTWQLVAVTFHLYPTPIATPIGNLRPARETCEVCHWPATFVGDKLLVKTVYTDDEANTELKTAVLLRVGGIAGRESSGIHWHVNPGVRIRYKASADRQTIYDVEATDASGKVKLFKASETPKDASDWRTMDCIDCHNRPTHRFSMPIDEVDNAMASGYMDKSLPFLKRESLTVLKADYPNQEVAKASIAREMRAFYQTNYPQVADHSNAAIEQAIRELQVIYTSNVFPQMKVTWGTYPDNIQHFDSPGCWRCHDRKHKTDDGEKIQRDCGLCHTILAQEEQSPAILKTIAP
ncbi:MAG TPA: NapC/NirT family cytochrome c [Steroidobacteraceae bacterium]|nr:NapC/NirT family cytochrome c [Steroidobacteraceae bacterium]